MGQVALILGGVRSGKSRFAQDLARQLGGEDVLFVATAEACDDEMSRRIDMHRQSRPAAWRTLEQPRDTGRVIAGIETPPCVILLDCLTLLVSNIVLQCDEDGDSPEHRMRAEIADLIDVVKQRESTMIIVSGEVGMGLVPENRIGRLFRDLLGWANQLIAREATSTYLMVAGFPINVKLIASSVHQAASALSSASEPGDGR